MNVIKKPVCHILAGEIRFKKETNNKKHKILLSWSPKNVQGEDAPHGTLIEK